MSAGEWRLITNWSRPHTHQASAKFISPSQLRRMRGCEQVTAVCYRLRNGNAEFLLVQTRGGRWTFPKGNAEPGLTHAQAAALEAFEEAGVHGRMEEASFARYVRRKRRASQRDAMATDIVFNAHLCEVLWLGPAQESGRNPTWFSPEKTKRRLREDRAPDFSAELTRLVDCALDRIRESRRRHLLSAPPQPTMRFRVDNLRTINGKIKRESGKKNRRDARSS